MAMGPQGDRQRLDPSARLVGVELVCPACRSDRVIPLNFPLVFGGIILDMPERPIAKCMDCGYRLSAQDVVAQEMRLPI